MSAARLRGDSVRVVVFFSALFHFELTSVGGMESPFVRDFFEDSLHVSTSSYARKEGFHRDLELRIEISVNRLNLTKVIPNDADTFELLIKQELPSSTYVDSYQQLTTEKTAIVLPVNTDVEASASHASTSVVFAFLKLDFSSSRTRLDSSITLPIHVRYHQPQKRDKFVSFRIPHPSAFITNDGFSSNVSRCYWHRLRVVRNSSQVVVRVPVGQPWHSDFVSFATCLITLSSCFYLCLVISGKWVEKINNL